MNNEETRTAVIFLIVLALFFAAGIAIRKSKGQELTSQQRQEARSGDLTDEQYRQLRIAIKRPITTPPPRPAGLAEKAKQTIGRELFVDPIMSVDGAMTCAKCHNPDGKFGYSDGLKVAVGRIGSQGTGRGLIGIRRTRSLINCGDLIDHPSNWDGRASGIAGSCLQAITDPLVMGYPSLNVCVNRINRVPRYVDLSAVAFGTLGMTVENLREAFVAYLRTIRSDDTLAHRMWAASKLPDFPSGGPISKWQSGMIGESIPPYNVDKHRTRFLTETVGAPPNVARGFLWFLRDCSVCHDPETGWRSFDFHRSGLVVRWKSYPENAGKTPDRLRGAITRNPADNFKSTVPTVIDVARHPPYGYNGSVPDLATAVNYFCHGGRYNLGGVEVRDPGIDPLIGQINMTKAEEADVLAFLTIGTQSEVSP